MRQSITDLTEPLAPLPAAALAGGVALFFAADVAYRWRDHHQLAGDRLLTALAALPVTPLATVTSSLPALGVLTAIGLAFSGWEACRRPTVGPVRVGI